MVTEERIENKVEELIDLVKEFEGGKSDVVLYAIEELVIWGADNHFEGVGILAEALMAWRNSSIEVLEKENAV